MDGDDQDAVSVAAHPFAGGLRLVVTGAMDIANAAPVTRLLRDAAREHAVVVVDLNGVTFLDSLGIAELHRLHRDFARQGRDLAVAARPDTVAGKVLRITRLDAVWNLAERDTPRVVGPRPPPE